MFYNKTNQCHFEKFSDIDSYLPLVLARVNCSHEITIYNTTKVLKDPSDISYLQRTLPVNKDSLLIKYDQPHNGAV